MLNKDYLATYVNRYYERSSCHVCSVELKKSGKKYWHFVGLQNKRRYVEVVLSQCCETCSLMDEQLAEATEQFRRFTLVGCFDGDRCICGSVTHANLGFCIQCWRANRMLEKAQAEARLISKALKELRAEIKSIQRPELV